jgi:hypothetical protein
MEISMEFHEKFHENFPWKNSMKKIRQMFMENSMEFSRLPWIFPWNSMQLRLLEFHGKFHGIP